MDQTAYSAGCDLRKPEDRAHANRPTTQGADIHRIREFNRLLVLNAIRTCGPISRVLLAQHLGLSRPTISSIMDMLLQEGIVREGHFLDAAPRGGRRAILVHFQADAGYILGIEMGRTHLTMILTNLTPEIVSQRSVKFAAERGPAICLPILLAEIRTFVETATVSWDTITGIGLGISSPISADTHQCSSPLSRPGWETIDIWEVLQQAFHKPLYIDHAANMGVLSESRCGAGRGWKDSIYVTIGASIGCGLILRGELYRGHQGSAGELGHLSIDEHGPLCFCGKRGCLETLATTSAIIEDAWQGTSLALRMPGWERGSPPAGRAPGEIAAVVAAARQGDASSIAALEKAGERIGLALAALVNLFNPAAIVIDGVVACSDEILLAPLRRVAASASLPAAWQGTRLLTGELGVTAIALGAALMVLDAAFTSNAPTISLASIGAKNVALASLPSHHVALAAAADA